MGPVDISVHECMNILNVLSIKYLLATKYNSYIFVETWMILRNDIVSTISHAERDKYSKFSLINEW